MTEVDDAAGCPMCGGSGVVARGSPLVDEQTVADSDETASDDDQTWSDHDQSASDRDQRSADEDQQASDADLAAGSDPVTHEQTTAARARASRDRADASQLRDETALKRLATAADRDSAAGHRDREAEARDHLAHLGDVRDVVAEDDDVLLKAERLRARAASDRAKAADDRARAAVDRRKAAADRSKAFEAEARARRSLVLAATDELTGTWTRRVGLASIAREVERAGRTGVGLVLAFIDVDGLKEVNDSEGHAAGDRLLRSVADAVRANVRRYDVIVRHGGDEFLCAMPNLTRATAEDRMRRIAAALSEAETRHSITFGLAEFEPGDDLDALVSRADADLLRGRRLREGGRG